MAQINFNTPLIKCRNATGCDGLPEIYINGTNYPLHSAINILMPILQKEIDCGRICAPQPTNILGTITTGNDNQPTNFTPDPTNCTPACYGYVVTIAGIFANFEGGFLTANDAYIAYNTYISTLVESTDFTSGDEFIVEFIGTCLQPCPPDQSGYTVLDEICFKATPSTQLDFKVNAFSVEACGSGQNIASIEVETVTDIPAGFLLGVDISALGLTGYTLTDAQVSPPPPLIYVSIDSNKLKADTALPPGTKVNITIVIDGCVASGETVTATLDDGIIPNNVITAVIPNNIIAFNNKKKTKTKL